jgi:hypothetical protein
VLVHGCWTGLDLRGDGGIFENGSEPCRAALALMCLAQLMVVRITDVIAHALLHLDRTFGGIGVNRPRRKAHATTFVLKRIVVAIPLEFVPSVVTVPVRTRDEQQRNEG